MRVLENFESFVSQIIHYQSNNLLIYISSIEQNIFIKPHDNFIIYLDYKIENNTFGEIYHLTA